MTGHDHSDGHDYAQCIELFRQLSEFIDGEASEEWESKIKAHLVSCKACYTCLDILKRTVELCHHPASVPIPQSLYHKLIRLTQSDPPRQ